MKLLKMGAAAVAIVSTIALTGCSGGSWFDSGDEPVIVRITEVKEGQGVTQAQAPQSKEPQKAAVSEVSADSVLSPTGAFHYSVGGSKRNCQIHRGTLTCGGTPPAENSLTNERGFSEKVGSVSLGDKRISWHAGEIVGGIHDEKVLGVKGRFSQTSRSCSLASASVMVAQFASAPTLRVSSARWDRNESASSDLTIS